MVNQELFSLALVPVLGVALTLGVATTVVSDDGEVQAADSEMPAEFVGHVTAEKNGEVVAEVENVMLDGERIITQQATGENTLAYNTIALGHVDGDANNNFFNSDDPDLAAQGSERFSYDTEEEGGIQGSGDNILVDGFEPVQVSEGGEVDTTEGDLVRQLSYQNDGQEWEIVAEFELTDPSHSDDDRFVSSTGLEVNGDVGFHDNPDQNTFAATDLGREIPMRQNDRLTITWEVTPQNQ